jgi:hypothetical protein
MDTNPPQSPDPVPQPDAEQQLVTAPVTTPLTNFERKPEKRSWFQSRIVRVGIAMIVVLLVLGALSPRKHSNKHSDTSRQAVSSTTKAKSNEGSTTVLVPVNGLSSAQINSSAPVNEKTYFNTVWTHLDTIGKLSESMNQSCSANFPAPEPCAGDIHAFQAELLKTKADLDQVSAPTAFTAADATLRSALNADIQATNDALTALQAGSLTKWLVAVNEHAVAGKQLNLAGTQALDVLN